MSLAFLDTNIPIYAAGQPHPLKAPSARVLERVAQNPQRFITSAEVLQELLHFYRSRGAWPQGRAVLEGFAALTEERVTDVADSDVILAAELADRYPRLSARDLLHAAIIERVGAEQIVSADAGFDELSGVERLDPARLADWERSVVSR